MNNDEYLEEYTEYEVYTTKLYRTIPKNSVLIVYCRSGNRSSQAANLLEELGYTEVYDLGAMSNWEE